MIHLRVMAALAALLVVFPLGLAQAAVGWTYDGDEDSQVDWGALSPDYALCENGTEQSPVVISYTKIEKLPKLEFHYRPSRVIARIRHYTLEIGFPPGDTLSTGGHAYALKTLVLHMPSEHLVRDKFWQMELQFAHEDKAGKRLMVAVFVDLTAPSPAMQTLIAHLPGADGTQPRFTFDPSALLPKTLGYYAYTGSLTIPPCTEGVEWRVLKTPIEISQAQHDVLFRLFRRNARLEQPRYMRTILESK